MTSLLKALQQANPASTDDDASLFRSALVAILSQLQDEDGVSIQRSLKDWKQWLDDGAYESAYLMTTLGNVAEASMGVLLSQELIEYIQEISAKPGGLPLLIEHVHSSCPLLSQKIEELETLAIEEEQQLHIIGGGTKAGKDTAIAVGVLAGTAVTGLGIYAGVKYWKRFKNWLTGEIGHDVTKAEQAAGNEERIEARKAKRLTESIENDPDQIIKDLQNIDKIPNLGKGLENYNLNDLDTHVAHLVGKHLMIYSSSIENELKAGFMNEVRSSTQYKERLEQLMVNGAYDREQELLKYAQKIGFIDKPLSNDEYVAKVTNNLENQPWFKKAATDVAVNGMAKARKDLTADLTRSYSQFLSKEVETVKEKALQDGFDRLENDALKSFESTGLFTTSEIKVKLEISKLASEARDEEARLAEAAEADINRAKRLEVDAL